jgi:xanthine dehydrogenase accessory factor
MLHDGVETRAGMKLGDVDPRGERGYVDTISDKARALAEGFSRRSYTCIAA